MNEYFLDEISVHNSVSHIFEAYNTSKKFSKFTMFRETWLFVSAKKKKEYTDTLFWWQYELGP
jgi:hypothetical protein